MIANSTAQRSHNQVPFEKGDKGAVKNLLKREVLQGNTI